MVDLSMANWQCHNQMLSGYSNFLTPQKQYAEKKKHFCLPRFEDWM
jgi:hypothetical protein